MREKTRKIIREMNEPVVYRWIGPKIPPGSYQTKIILHAHHVNDGNRLATFYIAEAHDGGS